MICRRTRRTNKYSTVSRKPRKTPKSILAKWQIIKWFVQDLFQNFPNRFCTSAEQTAEGRKGNKNGWRGRRINCWTRQDKRRAHAGRGETEREVIGATGGWTVKGGAEHSSTLEGKAISGPQLKTNTCLLTSPLSWLVKSQWNDVCIGTLPLPRSVSPSKLEGPNRERCRQSGELDHGQIGENALVLAA